MRGFWAIAAGALTLAFVLGVFAATVMHVDQVNQEMVDRVEDGGGRR